MFEMCCSSVVTGGINCLTGEVLVSFWSVSKRFIAILTGLTGVIGRFETVDQFSEDEFCELRTNGVLGSPDAASCIAAIHYPLIGARLCATHRFVRMVNNT